MNQGPSNTDQGRDWLSAADAAALLGIKKETLYAYASRGLVRSVAGPGAERTRVYHRDDLERLHARSRARAGHAAVAAGALRWGEPVLETRVGSIDASGPSYRGTPALALADRGASFEEVCSLLWDSPFVEPEERGLGARASSLQGLLRLDAGPFDAMLVTAAALAASEPKGEGREVALVRASGLVRRLVAACALPRGTDAVDAALLACRATEPTGRPRRRGATRTSAPSEPATSFGTARALLVALGARTTAANVAAMNEALVLSAEHELTVSTFASRVTASSGATLSACVLAALAALSGPLHGAATARVEALVAEIGRPERAAQAIAARLERGESVPGFGHPLYPHGDPRGLRLLETANGLTTRPRALRVIVAVADTMRLVAREDPTLDVGLAALSAALSLPRGAPLAIFACGRLAGWIAHALEQRDAAHLLRPRARYVGREASRQA